MLRLTQASLIMEKTIYNSQSENGQGVMNLDISMRFRLWHVKMPFFCKNWLIALGGDSPLAASLTLPSVPR